MKSVHDICRHRWTELLPHVGIDPKYLTGKHTPCPVCGGKDRFRYLNTKGKGGAICNQCGGFNPVDLVMQVTGRDFQEAARELEKLAGSVEPEKPRKARDNAKCREASSALWKGSEALTGDDPVSRYLEARGIDWRLADGDIRYHPSCSYHVDGNQYRRLPAMVAKISDREGKGVSVHRTFLTMDGRKADVEKPKQMMPGGLPKGVSCRTMQLRGDTIGIAEGIETALSAAVLHRVRCWATLNSSQMVKWEPPEGVKRVIIFGDCDLTFTGQAAAYSIAQILKVRHKIDVEVKLPHAFGADWNDVLKDQQQRNAA